MLEMNTFIKHFIADIVCSQKDFKLHIKTNIICFGLPKELTVENAEIVTKFLKEI